MTVQVATRTETFKDRLTLALQAQTKRVDDVRNEVGLDRREWDAIRKSDDPPPLRVVRRLADALDVPATYLAYDQVSIELPSYRRHSQVTKRRERRTTIDIQHALFNYLELEDVLEQPHDPFAPPVDEFDWSVGGDIERAAGMVREWLGIDEGDRQPNIHASLDDRLRLLPFDTPATEPRERIDGCVVWSSRGGSNIAFNTAAPIDRQRFTLAHELGHLVFGAGQDRNDEKAANQFASAFLMPANLMRDEGPVDVSLGMLGLLRLKVKFGCSVAAINMRCRDLGLITDGQCKSNWMELSYRGWRKHRVVQLNTPM